MFPKISIITICLNSEKFLRYSIESVTNQSYENIEYIVIDGGSTDNTLPIIEEYRDKIDHFISEQDNGISDAMNKGLRLATGDYLLFLHSDDYLINEKAIESTIPFLNNGLDIYIFPIYLSFGENHVLHTPRGMTPWVNFKTGVFHQGAFCSKQLFKKIGGFDTSLRIAMDFDFFLRAYRERSSVELCNFPISAMRMVGVSSNRDWPSLFKRFKEEKYVHMKNCNTIFLHFLYKLFWIFYIPYRKVLHYGEIIKGKI